jgi:hypothetical protein
MRLLTRVFSVQGRKRQRVEHHRQRGLCRTDGADSTVRCGAVGWAVFVACCFTHAFAHTVVCRRRDLHGNQISTVANGAFAGLTALTRLSALRLLLVWL